MSLPPLLGRRVHISGSISQDPATAPAEAVEATRRFVEGLVVALIDDGASFVVPVDRDPKRGADSLPVCFDWLVLETIDKNVRRRPAAAAQSGQPVVVAVQHYKNEAQVPDEYRAVWEALKETEGLLVIENAGRWNMNSKRMDIQAAHGDVLITLGGDEGVLYLANLYHDAGKPVIPLNFPITAENRGSLRLWDRALTSSETNRFFRTADGSSSHNLINRLNFGPSTPVEKQVSALRYVLNALRRPTAFAVRLLRTDHDDFKAVEDFFDGVVKPVVEEFGYEFKVVDGSNSEESIVNQEIFDNLYFSSVVVADVTGERPNCFIELGYALGRARPVMVCAKTGTRLPFDIAPVPTHFWYPGETLPDQRGRFRDYWKANINRRPIVDPDPLMP
jgi:hypothetical protein